MRKRTFRMASLLAGLALVSSAHVAFADETAASHEAKRCGADAT